MLEKEEIKSDIFMQGILKSSISRKWRENGIIIDEKLIVNQANLLYSPLSRGSGSCFYASYTLASNNYLDDEGFAIINGINSGRFEEIANDVALEVYRGLEIIVEENIIFVIAPNEDVAVVYYIELARYLSYMNITATFSFLWRDIPDYTGDGFGGSTGGNTGSSGDTGGDTGGGTGGGASGGTGGNPAKPPITPDDPGHIVVNLTTSEPVGEVEIGDVYHLIVDIYHTKQGPIPKITNIEYFINRVGTNQGGVLEETTEWICTRKAISAGRFQFVAVVHFEGETGNVNSNIVYVTEMCPPISKFKDLPVVQNRAIELWNETVNYSRLNKSTHETREFGCFIYLNTGTGEYHCGSTIPGDPIQLTAPGKGTVHFVYNTQSYDPRETFDLIVGTIHSHYPMTWAVSGLERRAGPSEDDDDSELPGIVYDYSTQIFAGDPVNISSNPMKMYIYGPDRRAIP